MKYTWSWATIALSSFSLCAHGFTVRGPASVRGRRTCLTMQSKRPLATFTDKETFAPVPLNEDNRVASSFKSLAPVVGLLSPLVMGAGEAAAKGGELGILEGKTVAFIHPTVMGALFLTSLYTGYLGWQWRSLRTIGGDISNLKAALPALSDGTKVSLPSAKQIAQLKGSLEKLDQEADASKMSQLQKDIATLSSSAVKELEQQIASLTETRKSLASGDFRDRHFNTASILLGTGVAVSILGAFDTYFRAGKLFPGPHLFAGAGITVLWAVAAAMVPYMQKGQDWARSLHIGLNALNVVLFAWQVGTGLEIALKVWELTKFP